MPLSQEQGSLGAIGYVQFSENMVQVLLYSLWANEQLLGDLCVGQALGQQSKDFQFPSGEHGGDLVF